MLESQLQPSVPDYTVVCEKEIKVKHNAKKNFDIRHRANILEPLLPGQQVWILGRRDSGVIVEQTEIPRSYHVSTPTGVIRRNRRHLKLIPETENSDSRPEQTPDRQENVVPTQNVTRPTTRSGRVSVPPNRLIADPNWNT